MRLVTRGTYTTDGHSVAWLDTAVRLYLTVTESCNAFEWNTTAYRTRNFFLVCTRVFNTRTFRRVFFYVTKIQMTSEIFH